MSVTRVKLADGKYCYTGPNCKWHSANGIAAARKELRAAERDLASAQTFEELLAAKTRQTEAIKVYDTTSEGLAELEKQVATSTDEVDRQYLQARLDEAQIQAAQIEADAQKQWEAAEQGMVTGSIALSDNHTYDEPTYRVEGTDIYAPTVGSKYTGYRDVADVAKDVRKDLKEAQAKGYLPPHLTFSVTVDKYSMGQSLRTEIRGVTDEQQYTYDEQGRADRATPEAIALQKRVSAIAGAYNSSVSRGEIDYFQHMYYSNVSIEDNHARQWREKEANIARQKRATAGIRKDMVAQHKNGVDKKTLLTNSNVKFDNVTKDGIKFGKIEGTSFYAFEYPSRIEGNAPNYYVYDLTAAYSPKGQTLEEALKDSTSSSVLKRFKRNRFL